MHCKENLYAVCMRVVRELNTFICFCNFAHFLREISSNAIRKPCECNFPVSKMQNSLYFVDTLTYVCAALNFSTKTFRYGDFRYVIEKYESAFEKMETEKGCTLTDFRYAIAFVNEKNASVNERSTIVNNRNNNSLQ